ncbi:MAG: hypothetical protein RJB65_906, partial [Actinomycetota bacterium]
WSRIAAIIIAVVMLVFAAAAKKDTIAKVAQHATEHE